MGVLISKPVEQEQIVAETDNFLLVCTKCCLKGNIASQIKLCKNKGAGNWSCYGDNLSKFLLQHSGCSASGIIIKPLESDF